MIPAKLTKQVVCLPDYPLVTTTRGTVRGMVREDIFTFRGIPYARAERFHMPTPAPAWEGIRDAIVYGPVCPQEAPGISPVQHLISHCYWPQDENCHSVNVWSPGLDNKRRPTIVWIHGGGWSTGSSIEQYAYDGENLSRFADVVVVSLNHRLNLLGYLDLSEFGEEYRLSDCAGLADLVEGLKWVRDNVAAFGGDPDNVTIMGQSGGGSKVVALMQTPSADGLYHKAIIESGGERSSEAPKGCDLKAIRQEIARRTLGKLGIGAANIADVQRVPYAALASAAQQTLKEMEQIYGKGTWGRWEPLPDGEYFVSYPHITGFREETAHIPMLTCTVFGEQQINLFADKNQITDEQVAIQLTNKHGVRGPSILSAFGNAYPEKQKADVLFMDTRTRPNMLRLAKLRSRQGCQIWNALFALESPMKGGITPWHCAEIPYVFHNAQYNEASYIPGVSEELQKQIAGAWAAFARTGDPNTDLLPHWPDVTSDTVPTMIFDQTTRVASDHDKELLTLLGCKL